MSESNGKRLPKMGKPPRLRLVGHEEAAKKVSEYPPVDALYFRELHRIIDEVYLEAYDQHQWSWHQLAAMAGLSYQTVANLGERRTRWPQFRTVWRRGTLIATGIYIMSFTYHLPVTFWINQQL